MSEPLVLPFADARAESVFRAGGKGANLARMARAGFPVPDGVVVTAACYRSFTAAWPELEERALGLPVTDPKALHQACATLRDDLLRRPFPTAVEEALREALPEAVSAEVFDRAKTTKVVLSFVLSNVQLLHPDGST